MADFCTKCVKRVYGNVAPDINVEEIFSSLEKGMCSSGFLCEGCGLSVIGKNDDGELKVIRISDNLSDWEDY